MSILLFLSATSVSYGQAQDVFEASAPVLRMYRTYCATCHGENGDARGDASRFVFPKPRDFQNSSFRWVTSENGVPTKEDIIDSIERGVPGTSMQSWESLGDEKIGQLAELVIQFRNTGIRNRIEALLLLDGYEDPATMALNTEGRTIYEQIIKEKTIPGAIRTVALSPLPEDQQKDSIERGSKLYVKMSCAKCHGDRGQGSFKMDLFNDRGYPTFATDFRRDPIKSVDDAAMARVILYGLPGASMPSSQMSKADVQDLISYLRSLATREPQYLTNIQRYYRAIGFRRPK